MEKLIFCVLKGWERLTYLKKQPWMIKKKLSRNIRGNVFRSKVCRCKRKICKIDKVSLSIVKVIFTIDGLVIPGSFDGSYFAAGKWNIIFFVTQGKGRSFKCDRTCINNAPKICEHVIVIAEKCGNLPEICVVVQEIKSETFTDRFSFEWCTPKSIGKKI